MGCSNPRYVAHSKCVDLHGRLSQRTHVHVHHGVHLHPESLATAAAAAVTSSSGSAIEDAISYTASSPFPASFAALRTARKS